MNAVVLVDCNNFFVSCERVFRPELAGRPVVVLSGNDGCVISRSQEAKALGVPMGVPFFEVRALAAEHDIAILSGNHELYGDLSRRVMMTLSEFSPEMEVYSVDEAFLTLPDDHELPALAVRLRETVRRWTGIPVSVGLAPTKVLAKLASERAKAASGVFSLLNAAARARVLAETPVGDVWGIGKRLDERLASHGLSTVDRLCAVPDRTLLQILGVGGLKLVWELRGTPCLGLEDCPPPKRTVTCSRSFGTAVGKEESLLSAVASFTASAAESMRRQDLRAGGLAVWTEWREEGRLFTDSRSADLEPTADTRLLVARAKSLAEPMFAEGRRYKKAGVTLLGLEPGLQAQREFFDDGSTDRARRLMKTVDGLNGAYGSGTLRPAAALHNAWKPRASRRSPCWSTRWKDLPAVKS